MTPAFPTILSYTALAAVALLAAAAAVHDVIARTIPNGWCAAIALLGLPLRFLDHSYFSCLTAATTVFGFAIVCWCMGWLGGGDVKLLGACALAIPPHLVPSLVVDTSIAGTLLALVYLTARNRIARPRSRSSRPTSLLGRAARAERWRLARGGPLPYAVAIASATIVVLIRSTAS